MSDIGDLVHSSEADNDDGENLLSSSHGDYSIERMVGLWSDEKRVLAGLADWRDDFEAVGHYTQMVWHSTREVGCAVASNAKDDYLVCRYSPAGNVEGEQPIAPAQRVNFAANR